MKTTVIVPTYNEAENLPKLVDVLFALPYPDLKLLIVDDNSPDGTGTMADGYAANTGGRICVLHRAGKMGLGSAYTAGFRKAIQDGAEAVAQMDADFSHPPEKLVEMHEVLQGCSVVLGSRYIRGGKLDENWPLWRKGLSGWGNFYARNILRMPMRDVTGGFRLWRAEALQGMPLDRVRSNGYVFQVEMAYLAHRLGYSFCEVPIYFADRKFGQSKMSIRIQLEAAFRVWQLLGAYRDIQPKG